MSWFADSKPEFGARRTYCAWIRPVSVNNRAPALVNRPSVATPGLRQTSGQGSRPQTPSGCEDGAERRPLAAVEPHRNSLACPLQETANSSRARVAATYSSDRSRSRASARASGE